MRNIVYLLVLVSFFSFSQEQNNPSAKEEQEEIKIKLADKQVLRKGNDLYKEKK